MPNERRQLFSEATPREDQAASFHKGNKEQNAFATRIFLNVVLIKFEASSALHAFTLVSRGHEMTLHPRPLGQYPCQRNGDETFQEGIVPRDPSEVRRTW